MPAARRRIMQQVGGAFGAAVLVVILAARRPRYGATARPGIAAAFGHTFWWCVGFTVLAIVPALFLPGRPSAPGALAALRGQPASQRQLPAQRTSRTTAMPARPSARRPSTVTGLLKAGVAAEMPGQGSRG